MARSCARYIASWTMQSGWWRKPSRPRRSDRFWPTRALFARWAQWKERSVMCRFRISRVLVGFGCAAMAAIAGLSGSYLLPLEHDAIQYATRPVADPISKLQRAIDAGQVKLQFTDRAGYLESVLEALRVPLESQVLVFSKTSFQAPRIAPRLPRALYFNDSVSVGWVRYGDVLEFAAVDPKQGVIFYTLDQEESAKPRFERRDTCLQCHATG